MELYIKKSSGRYEIADPAIIHKRSASLLLDQMARKIITFENPSTARDFLIAELGTLEHEVFCCIFLNTRHQLISFDQLFRGTIDGASVYPREVVKAALNHNASAVIFSHNHPSGIPEPSSADITLTRRLKTALELVDIRTLDHLVVGNFNAVSFAERGLL